MVACIQCDQRFLKNFSADTFGARLLCLKKKILKILVELKQSTSYNFFLHFNSLCMAPIVFSWPLSSNVPRNFWWHMDTSMYLPSDRRRILSLRSLQHKIYYSTSVLDGVYPSIGRLFAFQLAYLYTTPAISSDYYFFLLLSWTMYSAIYTPCVSY